RDLGHRQGAVEQDEQQQQDEFDAHRGILCDFVPAGTVTTLRVAVAGLPRPSVVSAALDTRRFHRALGTSEDRVVGMSEVHSLGRRSVATHLRSASCPGRVRRSGILLIAICLIVTGLLAAAPAALAQSTLGTIRGTVNDAQGGVIPGATVTATDEDTGVTRETVSDGEGLYELSNLRPGTYSVDVTLSGFKAARRTGIVLRAASVARVDVQLEVGELQDVITVTAEGQNITVESQAIARGLDAQQLRDLPRNSRDIQDFLTLNPNGVGGFDAIQFLGGRTYGASYVQDGQPSSAGIFGELSNAAPGLDAIAEVQVLSNSYSAEFGGLAGVVVSTKRGTNRFSGTSFYDFNSNELNARTYAQTL